MTSMQEIISVAEDVESLRRKAFLLYVALMGAEFSSDASGITEMAGEIAVGMRELQKKVESLRADDAEEPVP